MAKRVPKVSAAEVRADMIRQLRERGADVPLYLANVDVHMDYFAKHKKLHAKISKAEKEGTPTADLYKSMSYCATEMLKIQKQMGLTPLNHKPLDSGGGDL